MPDILYPRSRPSDQPYAEVPGVPASNGGRGSFSYADTKVFGPRQAAALWLPLRFQGNSVTGEAMWLEPYQGTVGELLLPGGGGGAKAPGRRFYGSYATGFKPQGMVLLRLIKLN